MTDSSIRSGRKQLRVSEASFALHSIWGFDLQWRFLQRWWSLHASTEERSNPGGAAALDAPVRMGWAFMHVFLVVCLIGPSFLLYRDNVTTAPFSAIVTLWLVLGTTTALSAFLAMAPTHAHWNGLVLCRNHGARCPRGGAVEPKFLGTDGIFGLMHGALWLPGILAGLAYGHLLMRSSRMGDAVIAHATTNALLTTAVLVFDQWQFW